MAKTYYWKLDELSGSAGIGANWIDDPAGTSGTLPGSADTAEIGALIGSVTVTFSGLAAIQTLALGGANGFQTSFRIAGGGLAVNGGIADSWTLSTTGQTFAGGGTVALEGGGRLLLGGGSAVGVNVTFDGSTDLLILAGTTLANPQPGLFAGQVSGFGGTGAIVLNVPYDARDTLSYAGGLLRVFGPGGTEVLDIRVNQPAGGFALAPFTGFPGAPGRQYLSVVACFARGTRLLTPAGEVAVETLVPGDRVLTPDGAERPVRWIGRRRVDLAAHPDRRMAAPVRIRRDAIAPGAPARDLLVSPDHAIFLGGALIPARLLMNGHSVVQECHVASVEYFHLELDRHAVVLAEGLAAESYLDTGNRASFANGGATVTLHPAFVECAAAAYAACGACAPLALEASDVEPVWAAIAARAGGIPSAPVMDADAGLALEIAGRPVRAVIVEGGRHVFALPPGAGQARLISRAATPAETRPFLDDRRMLGVKIGRLTLDGRALALDGPDLGAGWWTAERDGRWTDGAAAIALPADGGVLEVQVIATLDCYPAAAGIAA